MTVSPPRPMAQIQTALAEKGHDPGPIDGIWGRRTQAAVRAFQALHGLTIDGIVGPKTWAALIGTPWPKARNSDVRPDLVWYHEARRMIGLTEGAGARNNPVILDWASDLGIAYTGDDIAWCGLFVAHCIGATLPEEALPTNPLGARAWMKFGSPCRPKLGAVMVFWRGKPAGWQGHVGFYAGEEADGTFHILGGNQGNRVSIARIAKGRLLGARWPATVAADGSGTVQVTSSGNPLSDDEA